MPSEDSAELSQALQQDQSPIHIRSGYAGTSSGVNIAPGSDDDGWIVPPMVHLADGSRVQLYKDGEALHAAYQAIKNARRRICLEIYIFRSDATGRAFAELLSHKARNGVEVFVIYDSFGSWESDARMFEMMRRSGAHVQQFHPMLPWKCNFGWRPFNRNHRKLLLIDNERGGLGGLNLGGEYAGSWVVRSAKNRQEVWRDDAIGIVGPSVTPLVRSFARTWHYVTHGGRAARALFIHNLDFSQGDLGVLASVPTLDSPLAEVFRRQVRQATRSVWMTMAYFAPSDGLIDELCAAARRGVRVRLMLPSRCDVVLLVWAARSFYEKLLSAGVEIYERQGAMLHAKTLVIDGEISVIGSTNLDYRSVEYNFELSVFIRSGELGGQVESLFEHDVFHAARINLRDWRRRPMRDRFGQWAVSRARYLL